MRRISLKRLCVGAACLLTVLSSCNDSTTGLPVAGHALIFGTARNGQGAPVSAVAVDAGLRTESCDPPDLLVQRFFTDGSGRFRGTVRTPPELVDQTACFIVAFTPPTGSGLQPREAPPARVLVSNIIQSPDSVRIDAILAPTPEPSP
jgi:hypothetical protein